MKPVKLLALLLALICCMSLFACTNPNTNDNDTSDSESVENTVDNDTSEDTTEEETTAQDTAEDTTAEDTTVQDTTAEDTTVQDTTAEDTTAGETEYVPEEISDRSYNVAEIIDSLKIYGRTKTLTNGLTCDYTASGIEFNAYVEGAIKLTVASNAEAYFTVYVDGVRSATRFKVASGNTTIELATFAEGGVHSFKIVKQTEAMNALCVLTKLEFRGELIKEKPADSKYYIEFLGDSITCGYGNLCANGASNPGNAANQDGTKTYAYLASQTLGADYSMVCVSGIGITNGYRNFTASSMLSRLSYFRSTTDIYNPTRTPDVVVINLGTNDRTKGTDTTQFKADVVRLLNMLRSVYGNDTKIVWACNMMNDGYFSTVSAVFKELGGAEAGYYMAFLPNNREAGGGHPNMATHVSAAEQLVKFFNDNGILS